MEKMWLSFRNEVLRVLFADMGIVETAELLDLFRDAFYAGGSAATFSESIEEAKEKARDLQQYWKETTQAAHAEGLPIFDRGAKG